jgi:hypothetical protein
VVASEHSAPECQLFEYDLHPDGKRVAVSTAKVEGNAADDKVVFMSNFFDYLKKIAPARK